MTYIHSALAAPPPPPPPPPADAGRPQPSAPHAGPPQPPAPGGGAEGGVQPPGSAAAARNAFDAFEGQGAVAEDANAGYPQPSPQNN